MKTASYCTCVSQQQTLPGGEPRLFLKSPLPHFLILKQQQFTRHSSAFNQFLVCQRFCNNFITHELFLKTARRVLIDFHYFWISSPPKKYQITILFSRLSITGTKLSPKTWKPLHTYQVRKTRLLESWTGLNTADIVLSVFHPHAHKQVHWKPKQGRRWPERDEAGAAATNKPATSSHDPTPRLPGTFKSCHRSLLTGWRTGIRLGWPTPRTAGRDLPHRPLPAPTWS